MKRKIYYIVVGIVCLTLIGLDIYEGNLTSLELFLKIGRVGFLIILLMVIAYTPSHEIGGNQYRIDKVSISPDGIVVATLEQWTSRKGRHEYTSKVKRNYKDRVYLKEKNFEEADEAQAWLKETYESGIEKTSSQFFIGKSNASILVFISSRYLHDCFLHLY